ncbi:stressosome-associated protein Prli42 [Cytobacillus firmus]|nr:stressosome-associated protein Prli42 [Cytobacillus firmus]
MDVGNYQIPSECRHILKLLFKYSLKMSKILLKIERLFNLKILSKMIVRIGTRRNRMSNKKMTKIVVYLMIFAMLASTLIMGMSMFL